MGSLRIIGGASLEGNIRISGAKNAALPLLATALMTEKPVQFDNMPELADTRLMADLLAHLGKKTEKNGDSWSLSGKVASLDAPYELVSQMRASFLVMGPLLACYGEAKVSLPGGCAIGTRPVDLHIRAMQQLGAQVELADGYVKARAPKGLIGCDISFPSVSVGATENAMMAAALADGQTRLINAAKEPEITDLADCLNKMGAKISGAGTDIITIDGVTSLSGCRHQVVADRVEAGSFAIAAAMCGGTVTLSDVNPALIASLSDKMVEAGVAITTSGDGMTITSDGHFQAVDIETQPYPGFPTDLQAQFMAMMCLAEGQSTILETIFENRYMHVPELVRMGADIVVDGRKAIVTGKKTLLAAPVMATDLRASVSLVLAAMATSGTTIIGNIYHLDRGYADLETKLGNCGANLERID